MNASGRARAAVLLACLAGPAAAASPDTLDIRVTVSGAVTRTGAYIHPGDGAHTCRLPVEVPPAPGPGGHFDNLPFAIFFDPQARPPGNSFALTLPFWVQTGTPQHGTDFRIGMTAGGRFWEGEAGKGATGTIDTDPTGLTGKFRLTGLHSVGSADTLTVEGTWTCPH